MEFGGKFFQTKLLSRLSHKVCRRLSSPILLHKFTIFEPHNGTIGSLATAFLSDGSQPEVDFLQHWAVVWFKLSGSNSNTNLLAPRPIKREKASLPVDVCRSKTPLLKFPNHGRLLRHLDEEDDGKGERGKKETHLPALPSFYILKISRKLKKITSYADFLRRSPKNVCVGGYKRGYDHNLDAMVC